MGRNGEGEGAPSGPAPECCMCGDHGVSSELFTCKNCQFRSQHRYCSNLYPGAESYHICNWCLSQTDDKKGGVNTKTPPNSSHKTTSDIHQDDHDHSLKTNKKKRVVGDNLGERRTANSQMIKKQKLPAVAERRPAPSSAGRKRVTSDHGGIAERIITRTRSEGMSNGGRGMIIKQVFRNKVRRYKLLDEVSS